MSFKKAVRFKTVKEIFVIMLALIADVFTSKSEAEKRRLQEQISRNVLCLITMIHIFIARQVYKK